ncbi:MAG: hypothetical protein WBA41_00710 [Rivularia sp. (in: cyanobacteria)]
MSKVIDKIATVSIENNNNENCLYNAPALAMPFDTSNPNQHQNIEEAYARWLWENIKLRDTDVVELDRFIKRYNLKLIQDYQLQMSWEVWKDITLILQTYRENKQNISISGCKIASLKILSCLDWLTAPNKLTFNWLQDRCNRIGIPLEKCTKGYEINGKRAANLKSVYQIGIIKNGNINASY